MKDCNFIFYRDTEQAAVGWHETIKVLSAGEPPALNSTVMLDNYGKARKVTESSSRGRGQAVNIVDSALADDIRVLAGMMVSFATEFAIYGNIWQQWITYMMMTHENSFTMACERRTVGQSSTMMKLAEQDLGRLREIFSCDPAALEKAAGTEILQLFTNYHLPFAQESESGPGRQIRTIASRLSHASDVREFCRIITRYYASYGTGIYGLYKAFRVNSDECGIRLVPVTDSTDVTFDDLVGCEEQKKILRDNTAAFIKGAHANNVLLYGDSGTGKSTSIHALMHDFFESGLRLVEISKAERRLLPQVLSEIKKRNYKFIIYLDDLSFEENESDYKELKAMLEGALETRADRVLIYATSNRRHLIRETWNDRSDMEYQQDIHHSDTMEEKLSLASRFGVTIYYSKPDAKEYLNIVSKLAKDAGIKMDEQELADAARKWELRHGGMSGRTARQLISWLQSGAALEE